MGGLFIGLVCLLIDLCITIWFGGYAFLLVCLLRREGLVVLLVIRLVVLDVLWFALTVCCRGWLASEFGVYVCGYLMCYLC